jgi:hypothetical protein
MELKLEDSRCRLFIEYAKGSLTCESLRTWLVLFFASLGYSGKLKTVLLTKTGLGVWVLVYEALDGRRWTQEIKSLGGSEVTFKLTTDAWPEGVIAWHAPARAELQRLFREYDITRLTMEVL